MQQRERELCAVHFLGDPDVQLFENGRVGKTCLGDLLLAIRKLRAQLLHRSLDAGGDLTGLLVTDGFRKLGARMG